MSRFRPFRLLGLAAAGLVAFSIGSRPALKAQQPAASIAPTFVGGAFGGTGIRLPEPVTPVERAMSIAEAKTRLKLYEKIPMNFPTDTPLSDVIKHIRESTVDKTDFPDGLPIYVDPVGLQDADKTLADTVLIELKSIPLGTSLRLALAQLDLGYWVNPDGLLIIKPLSSEDMPVDVETKILSNLSALRHEVLDLREEVRELRGLPRQVMMGSVGGMLEPSKGSK